MPGKGASYFQFFGPFCMENQDAAARPQLHAGLLAQVQARAQDRDRHPPADGDRRGHNRDGRRRLAR